MNVMTSPLSLAPQISGHPGGLPEIVQNTRRTDRVAETAASDTQSRTAGDMMQREGQKSAPPTILQLKIDELLSKQAEQLAEIEAREGEIEAAEAEQAKAEQETAEAIAPVDAPDVSADLASIPDAATPPETAQVNAETPVENVATQPETPSES